MRSCGHNRHILRHRYIRYLVFTGERLAEAVKKLGNSETVFIANMDEIAKELTGFVKPGDIVLTMGAGNIDSVARELVQRKKGKWKEQL